jgi:hypothetical protein
MGVLDCGGCLVDQEDRGWILKGRAVTLAMMV